MSTKSVFILAFCCSPILINAKVFKLCELSAIFLQNSVPATELDTWLCLAKSASNFNSSQLLGRGFGIFQISSKYWCWDPDRTDRGYDYCNRNCKDLLDDDLADDIRCASTVMNRGIDNWIRYGPRCAKVSKGIYTSQCDHTNGLVLTSETNETLKLNGSLQRIVCTAEGSFPLDLSWQKLGENQQKLEFPLPVIKSEKFTNDSKNLTTWTVLYHSAPITLTAGKYTCEALNKYGSSMKTFYVSVEEPPSAIARLSSDASVALVAVLTITAGLVIVLSAVLQCYKRKRFKSEIGGAPTEEMHFSNTATAIAIQKTSTEQNIGTVSFSSNEHATCSDNKF